MASDTSLQTGRAGRGQRLKPSTPPRTRTRAVLSCALLICSLLLSAKSLPAQSGRNKNQQPPPPVTVRAKAIPQPTPLPAPQTSPSPAKTEPANSTASPSSSEIEELDPGETVRVDANLVTIPASVVDSQGRVVPDLKLEDFELKVEGQPKTLSELSRAETPVRMVLLFDNSMSLREAREFERHAAVKFLRRVLRPVDHAAIYSIYTYPILAQGFTNDVNTLVRTIERFPTPEDGATALFDTVAKAADYLRPFEGRKVIVIVSDGADTLSELDFDKSLEHALLADCQIYAVQTGQSESVNLYNLAASRRLQEYSAQTGGAVFVPKGTSDLDAAFAQIAADLAQQYVLSYYPDDDKRDGRFRTISLKIARRPNLRVRARKGYYPPKG